MIDKCPCVNLNMEEFCGLFNDAGWEFNFILVRHVAGSSLQSTGKWFSRKPHQNFSIGNIPWFSHSFCSSFLLELLIVTPPKSPKTPMSSALQSKSFNSRIWTRNGLFLETRRWLPRITHSIYRYDTKMSKRTKDAYIICKTAGDRRIFIG